MKRLISTLIMTSILAFGALHAAMGAGFGDSAHGSMETGFSCVFASCPTSGNNGMQDMDCVGHCLSAASTEFPASPVTPALTVVAILLFLAGQSLYPINQDRARRFSDVIGRLLLRQRLATVVLRN